MKIFKSPLTVPRFYKTVVVCNVGMKVHLGKVNL